MLTVQLRCKPIVKHYLVNRYGVSIAMPENDWVKLLIRSHLQRNHAKDDSDITLQYYTTQVSIPINMDVYDRYGDHLTKTATREINNRIEDVIYQQLFQFLEFYVHVANYQLKDAIAMFQTIYVFPEDVYSFDTIKKHYQRRIQPFINIQKFVGVNVPFKKKRVYKRAS